jgi:hypothetical protein
VLLAFFLLAVQLFITLLEFKLTTLAGFVLIPFGLFGKSAFMAERVLGNVVSSGIKVLVLAVIIGIGSTLFSEFTQGFGGDQPNIDEAMAIVLAALSLLGLGIFGPGIANGKRAVVGGAADDESVCLGAGSHTADDKPLVPQIRPVEFSAPGEPVILGKRDMRGLPPQLGGFAFRDIRHAGHERDVELPPPDRRKMLGPTPVPDVDPDIGTLRRKAGEEIPQERADQRGDDAHADNAGLRTARGGGHPLRQLELLQRRPRLGEETLARIGEAHPDMAALEQGDAEPVLEATDAAADAGLPNA